MAPLQDDDAGPNNNHNHDHEPDSLSERTPLLRTLTNGSAESGKPHASSSTEPVNPVPASWRRGVSLYICLVALILITGTAMQPAARVQIYEGVACHQYYATHPETLLNANDNTTGAPGYPPPPPPAPIPPNHPSPSDPCKATPVQAELALLKGYEFFFTLIPTILCTIPYGALSDRVGRRNLLILNLFGQLLAEFWTLAVCWWQDVFPARAIWLGGLLTFIGGGGAVASSVIHVMIADYADEGERTQIFLWLHAANVLAGFIGPIITAAIMEVRNAWVAALTAEAISFAGLLLLFFLPETLHIRERFQGGTLSPFSSLARPGGNSSSSSSSASPAGPSTQPSHSAAVPPSKAPTLTQRAQNVAASFTAVAQIFALNPQALLLLILYAPLLMSRDAFSIIGIIMVPHKFGLKYSTASLILSLRQGVETVVVLLFIPGISYVVTSPRFGLQWSAWTRDRMIAIASFGIMAAGQLLQGLAPTVWLAIAGLAAVGMASGVVSTTLSLLGSAVAEKDVSVVYSTAVMTYTVVNYAMAPVLSILFNKGMALGWAWEGLPFTVLGGVIGLAFAGSWFIAREPPQRKAVDAGE